MHKVLIVQKENIMQIITDIQQILRQARQNAYRSINKTMLEAYWLVGKRIVEDEQQGENRAVYGKSTMKTLSEELLKEFGKGFSVVNLQNMRLFYLEYPIQQTLSVKSENKMIPESFYCQQAIPDFQLSWSHYQMLIRIADKNERAFYEIEAAKNQWSLRELKRQFDSALYVRLALSKDKEGIKALSTQGHILEKPQDAIKDPYILEFLGLKEHHQYSESDLENKLIDKLEYFLLELGTGFTFVARQTVCASGFETKHNIKSVLKIKP